MSIRSAEKARNSSCPAADNIAHAVMAKYKSFNLGDENTAQLVLAGIVAILDEKIHVISLGVGNKFQPTGTKNPDLVRDCHAEVLARRAFKRWLLQEYQLCTQGKTSSFFSLDSSGKIVPIKSLQFVLYVSSAPCGNACIRRWGDSPKETFNETLGVAELLNDQPHPPFHPHSQKEGQTAVNRKGESTILSCSDKILRWNVVGLQGVGLSGIVPSKIFLHGIVIGRKFVRKHSERAFCCRLSSKRIPEEIKNSVNHPRLMCTAVKLDEGAMDVEVGATFTEQSFWWHEGMPSPERLDGNAGISLNGETSQLSASMLTKLRAHIPPPDLNITALSEKLSEQLERL